MIPKKAPQAVPASSFRYPKPQAAGGKLIREAIGLLKEREIPLPLSTHILIATSGGLDSTVLSHLIATYGRKIVQPKQLELLHINHGWRGEASNQDEKRVQALGGSLGIPVQVHRLNPPRLTGNPDSLEDLARQERKRIFQKLASKQGAIILTAHHGDDLAETLLWRLFTGGAKTHGGGIAVHHGHEIRPFLRVRKALLLQYAQEEGLSWSEDETNHSGRFLRSKMRLELTPVLEKLFPRAVENLIRQSLNAQQGARSASDTENSLEALTELFGASGLKVRRPHWELLQQKLRQDPAWRGQIDLPGGWNLKREVSRLKQGKRAAQSPAALQKPNRDQIKQDKLVRGGVSQPAEERWILSRSIDLDVTEIR